MQTPVEDERSMMTVRLASIDDFILFHARIMMIGGAAHRSLRQPEDLMRVQIPDGPNIFVVQAELLELSAASHDRVLTEQEHKHPEVLGR